MKSPFKNVIFHGWKPTTTQYQNLHKDKKKIKKKIKKINDFVS
jgi:hypothetical protein